MLKTAVATDEHDLLEWYISESGGDLVRYHQDLLAGHRVGQAFFNALSREDQERLRATSHDPFYSQSWWQILDVIDYLTSK